MFLLPKNELFSVAEMTPVWSTKPTSHQKITCSRDIFDLIKPIYPQIDMYESFWIILLNQSNTVIGISNISIGGTAGTVADPKKIFTHALIANAQGIICVHNHPSDNVRPSASDSALTKKIVQAGTLLDIRVLDHVIVGVTDKYFSFADEGVL